MKTFRRVLLILVIIIVILVISGIFSINHISKRALPDYNAEIKLEGLKNRVEVYRDQYGIPNVYATNEEDLYRVVGYLQAQDRLWQMDLLRRVTTGRLSEIFGEDMVGADQLFRALRIPEKSKMVMDKTDPEIVKCIHAFSDGVNQFIQAHLKKLPFEFVLLGYKPDPWETVHTINLIGYMSWDLSMSWQIEIILYKIYEKVGREKFMELLPDLEIQESILPDFMKEKEPDFLLDVTAATDQIHDLGLQVFSGSNNWAVSGKKTKSGLPVVVNDMHLGLDIAPGIWSQMHHVVEGKLNVTGVVLPGAPFIICGHNDSVAWGMTNVMLDDMDFYQETLNPQDSSQYRFNGEWKKIEEVEEEIFIKGGEKVVRINRFTHRGPVVSGFKNVENEVISMRWIGNEYSNELRTVYLLNRANNWNEFKDAVNTFISISQNIVYGDAAGNIGLYCCAGVPIREGNRIFIAPGDTDLFDWKGLVPFDKLPYAYNPPEGFLVSANNRTTGSAYPYQISDWYDLPNRYNRIYGALETKDEYDLEDMKSVQTDQTSVWAEKILLKVLPILDKADRDRDLEQACELLKSWEFDYTIESEPATLFEVFYIEMLKALFLDEMGDELYEEYIGQDILASYVIDKIVSGQPVSWCDNVSTQNDVEDFSDVVVSSMKNAVKWLEENMDQDPEGWKWGVIHKISFTHPMGSVNLLKKVFKLEKGPYPVGGSYHTVCPFSYPLGFSFIANHGASQRQIFDFSDWDNSWSVIPTGVSGIPASDFYCNQTELYLNKEYHPDYFSKEKVVSNAKYTSVFMTK